jgi:hypothetical protein
MSNITITCSRDTLAAESVPQLRLESVACCREDVQTLEIVNPVRSHPIGLLITHRLERLVLQTSPLRGIDRCR